MGIDRLLFFVEVVIEPLIAGSRSADCHGLRAGLAKTNSYHLKETHRKRG
jgi:hypothetical protein